MTEERSAGCLRFLRGGGVILGGGRLLLGGGVNIGAGRACFLLRKGFALRKGFGFLTGPLGRCLSASASDIDRTPSVSK